MKRGKNREINGVNLRLSSNKYFSKLRNEFMSHNGDSVYSLNFLLQVFLVFSLFYKEIKQNIPFYLLETFPITTDRNQDFKKISKSFLILCKTLKKHVLQRLFYVGRYFSHFCILNSIAQILEAINGYFSMM